MKETNLKKLVIGEFSEILDKFNTMIIFETVEHNHVPEGFI
jgi:hypothetical protein